MDKTRAGTVIGAVAVMLAVAWLLSMNGGTRIKAQAQAAADSGDDGMVSFGASAKLTTGTVPDKWCPHIPAGAHMGRHRMYRHPRSCSPNLTAPQQLAYDWRYSPPSEGDI